MGRAKLVETVVCASCGGRDEVSPCKACVVAREEFTRADPRRLGRYVAFLRVDVGLSLDQARVFILSLEGHTLPIIRERLKLAQPQNVGTQLARACVKVNTFARRHGKPVEGEIDRDLPQGPARSIMESARWVLEEFANRQALANPPVVVYDNRGTPITQRSILVTAAELCGKEEWSLALTAHNPTGLRNQKKATA